MLPIDFAGPRLYKKGMKDRTWTHIIASNPRETACDGYQWGMDVDIVIRMDNGESLMGDVTLYPDEDRGGRWTPIGDAPDQWISMGLLRGINEHFEGDGWSEMIDGVLGEAVEILNHPHAVE